MLWTEMQSFQSYWSDLADFVKLMMVLERH